MSSVTLDAHIWAQECSRRAAGAGVSFVWDETATTPWTDGKSVHVPPLPADATADDFTILRGSVIHECGHILRPAVFDIAKREKLKQDSPLMALLNIVEDAAQERASAMRWHGDRVSLAASHRAIVARQIRKAGEPMPEGSEIDPAASKLMAAMGTALVSAADWSDDMDTLAARYISAMDTPAPGTEQLFTELLAEKWPEKIAACGDEYGAWEVARALYARLFPETPESENKSSGDDGDSDGDDGDGEPKRGKRAAKGGDGDEKGEAVRSVIPWELIQQSDHSPDGRPMPSSIDWTGKTAAGAPVFSPTVETHKPKPSGQNTRTAERMIFPSALVNEVRRLLQARARVRFDHERLDGRLDGRNLQRVLMPQVGDGTYNRSVFRQRVETQTLDVALTVLVDCSGSMSGSKIEAATAAAMALQDMAATALRIPCEVLGFTTYGRTPVTFEFKTFAERRLPRTVVGARMEAVANGNGGHMSGNADGDSLMDAARRIRSRRETRRIIVVLSDGCPADCVGADPYTNLKGAITAIRRDGIEVYGIGIEDRNVQEFYSANAPVIDSAADVPAALINVLKDVLQREGSARRN